MDSKTCDSDCSVSSDDEDFDPKISSSVSTSSDDEETGAKAASAVLLENRQATYKLAYDRFEKWCEERDIKNDVNEDLLLAYFEYKSKLLKACSLWSHYSMLRTVISIKRNVDIRQYERLKAFLKEIGTGYQTKRKKSRILTRQEVTKFLTEADDNRFLLLKVALILGLSGACRSDELAYLLFTNVHDEGEFIRIVVPTRTKVPQEFFVTAGAIGGLNFIEIIRKYVALRPTQYIEHGRFFVAFKHRKCTIQPVGKNTFSVIPKVIASFLKLSNPEEFTGQCFKRSASSLER